MGHPCLRAGTARPDCCWAVLGPEVQPIGRHGTTRCVGRAGPTDFVPSTAVPSRAARFALYTCHVWEVAADSDRWWRRGTATERRRRGGQLPQGGARRPGRVVRGGGARTCGGAPMPWQGAARGRRGASARPCVGSLDARDVGAQWRRVRGTGVRWRRLVRGAGTRRRGHGAAAASRRDAVARRLHAR